MSILTMEEQKSILIPIIIISNVTWIVTWILLWRYRNCEFIRKRSISALVIYNYGMFAFEVTVVYGWKIFEDYTSTVIPVEFIDFMGFTGVISNTLGYALLLIQYNIIRMQSKFQLQEKADLSWGDRLVVQCYCLLEGKSFAHSNSNNNDNNNNNVQSIKQNLRVLRPSTVYKYGIVTLLGGILVSVLSHLFWANNADLVDERISVYARLCGVIFGFIFQAFISVMVIVVMKDFRDSLSFVSELRVTFLFVVIPCSVFFVLCYIIPKTSPLRQNFGSNISLIPVVVYSRLLSLYYLYNCMRSSINSSNGGLRDLIKIITNRDSFDRLKSVMADGLCLENALYLEDLMRAHKDCNVPLYFASYEVVVGTATKRQIAMMVKSHEFGLEEPQDSDNLQRAHLKSIYYKFVHPNSPYELNISYNLRNILKKVIEDESSNESSNTKDQRSNNNNTTSDLSVLKELTLEVINMIVSNNLLHKV